MICDNCKKDRIDKDFIFNQKFCYYCEYQKKRENIPKKQTKRKTLCRTCKKPVIQKKDVKKRQRTVFCSQECALIGHKELNNQHWTRKLRNGAI